MANYLTDIIRRAEKYGAKNNLGRLLSALEVGANMGTSSIAQMGGGLSYVPAAIMGGDKAGQAVKGSVERAFTYEPRTQGARNFFNKVGEYAAPVMQYGSQKVDRAADAAFAATGSPVIGAAVKTLPTALSVAADRIRIGKAAPDRMELTAYHGSPHDFENFDLSKIGTGEGAQAYGHGLYFAESPQTAGMYQASLSKNPFPDGDPRHGAWIMAKSRGEDKAREYLAMHGADVPDIDSAMQDVKSASSGRLYTVDIPDEAVAKFLDWDKPLSEQPQSVRDALSKLDVSSVKDLNGLDIGGGVIRKNDGTFGVRGHPWVLDTGGAKFGLTEAEVRRMAGDASSLTADQFYTRLAKQLGSQSAASAKLAELGVPGIRYLDAGSRQGGKGTSNFVVFDDKLVKVLKKE